MKKKRVFISIHFILLVLFLLILSTFIYLSTGKPQRQSIESTELTPETILVELRNELSGNFDVSEVEDFDYQHYGWNECGWWRSDNYAVCIEGKGIKISDRTTDGDWKHLFKPLLERMKWRKINNEVQNYLISKGFVKNEINSYFYQEGDFIKRPLRTLAFEKGEIKCKARWRSSPLSNSYLEKENKPFYAIACGVYDEQVDPLNKILPFLEPGFLYVLEKRVGNYVAIQSSKFPCCSGALWVVMKEGDQWKPLFGAQESPSCEIVDKYKIPLEIYGNCYEDQYNLRFSR